MKILVFTVSSWNSKVGANTWATLLDQYDSANIANICIRDEIPDSPVCSRYFNISENKIIKSVFNRKIKTGKEINQKVVQEGNYSNLKTHNERYRKMKKKRRYSMLLVREFVWKIGKWKTNELNNFLDDFKPDIILHSMEGYIHLNRIVEYSIDRTGAKAIGYIWDDNFTYKQSSDIGYKIYRFFQRKSLKKLAKKTKAFFAITPKTKREADDFFGINSVVLSKPLNSITNVTSYENVVYPLEILYTGNLLIGRDKSLQKIVDILKEIPNIREKIKIEVYTQTELEIDKLSMLSSDFCHIHPAISQEEVLRKQKKADVLLFLEDIDGKDSKMARLSFSTKITDYLSSGKCIFVVGNKDLAPIEYLKDNDAAIVASDIYQIREKITMLLEDNSVLKKYAKNAFDCGVKNHAPQLIRERLDRVLKEVIDESRTN